MAEVEVSANSYPAPNGDGKDRYTAWVEEFPGTTAFGPTEDEARSVLRATLLADLATADSDRRGRLKVSEVCVQFNRRMTPEQKTAIAERAAKAGVSVRQYVINQCLYALPYEPADPAVEVGTSPMSKPAWG